MWERVERAELKRQGRHGGGQPAGPPPEPSLPAGTDLLPQIRHIVVLMMENHSYDNYLGMLQGRGEGFPLGADGKPEISNPDTAGEAVRAHHLFSTVQRPQMPSQSWHATHHQWDEGKHKGFVTSTQVVVPAAGDVDAAECQGAGAAVGMGYWTEDDLPFYYGLARTFPLADRWFSSCLGPTFPNRRFLIAGTAHGLIDDAPSDLLDSPPAGTIFDLLSRHGISWANYHPAASGQSKLRSYARHKRRMARRRLLSAGRALPAVTTGVQKDMQFTADVFPVGIGRYMRHVHSTDRFFADADNGTLPAFSIVDPDFDTYSEENPQDISKGESFAAEVINRVMHGKGWPGTLLIWLYDEHGGYYDHVPPPPAVPPDDVEGRSLTGSPSRLQTVLRMVFPKKVKVASNLDAGPHHYDRYGFRVPAVLVSPYGRPQHVCSEVLDHTSVLKLVEQKWNLPPLTARDAAAASPLSALDLTGPPAFLEPPSLPKPTLTWGSW
ncbi:MAG: Phospholipase 4 precursor [Actinomycetia bacterium]|nr:Phospholipase 4 precursor [Actinomycetes bacterium]